MAGTGDELARVADWLYDFLKADGALTAVVGGATTPRIYEDVAPQPASYPCVVYAYEAGTDVGNQAAERIMHSGLWLVKGINEGRSYQGDLKTIADRIDALLHRSSGGSADGATIFTSVRERPVHFPEDDDGVEYRHSGGQYRILVQLP